jgi:hypothetical protein
MSDFFEDLAAELRDAVPRASQHQTRRQLVTRRPRRPTPALLAAVATVAIVGAVIGIIVTHGHRRTPTPAAQQSPTAPPAGWGRLSGQAVALSRKRDAGCRLRKRTGPSPVRYGAPPAALSARLAVLRRPTLAGHRISPTELRHIGGGPVSRSARGVYIRYARQGVRDGVTYYLIPAANVTEVYPVPERCYGEQLQAFKTLANRRPASQRAALIAYETRWLKSPAASLNPIPGVCLFYATSPHSGGGTECDTAYSLRRLPGTPTGGFGSGGGASEPTVTPLIVPNNVATISATYQRPSRSGAASSYRYSTTHPADNVAILTSTGDWGSPTKLTYRSADGSILWSFNSPPSTRSVRHNPANSRSCQQNPASCPTSRGSRPAAKSAVTTGSVQQAVLGQSSRPRPTAASCREPTANERAKAPLGGAHSVLFSCNITLYGQPALYYVQVLANGSFIAERQKPGQAIYGCCVAHQSR